MQDTNSGSERRKFKRLKATFILTYQVNQPLSLRISIGWDTEVVALMLDLSEEGMAVSTDYDISVATIILIKFTLINMQAQGDERIKSMKITGEVKSNILIGKNEHRLGIHFTQIAERDKNAITEFVKAASLK